MLADFLSTAIVLYRYSPCFFNEKREPFIIERQAGLEPVTLGLGSQCSTN